MCLCNEAKMSSVLQHTLSIGQQHTCLCRTINSHFVLFCQCAPLMRVWAHVSQRLRICALKFMHPLIWFLRVCLCICVRVHVCACRYMFVYMRDTHVEAQRQAEVLILRHHPCVVWRHGSSLFWQSPNTVDWVVGELWGPRLPNV